MASEMEPKRHELRVRKFFEDYKGKRIFHPPLVDDKGILVGNNGDRLMVLGTEILYNDFSISKVDSGKDADLIVIGGNGGMLEKAQHIPRIFRNASIEYPDTPMCVLPSTYYYPTRDFAEEIGNRKAPLTLFCREPYSYDHLLGHHNLPQLVKVLLDSDMAFELADSDLVKSMQNSKSKHVLVVERVDVEHTNVAFQSKGLKLRKTASKVLPESVKKAIYPFVTAFRSYQKTPFKEQCDNLMEKHYQEFLARPKVVKDISNNFTCTFEEFCELIASSSVVFTTRLHVGILSSMLGIPTFIFEGPYHKIKGIYDYSLEQFENTIFVPKSS